MNKLPELYGYNNIHALQWNATSNGEFARRYLMPLLKNNISGYIKNVNNTDLRVLRVGNVILPVTITDYHPDNSYVCSPFNHYFAYGQEEFGKLQNPLLEGALRLVLAPVTACYRQNKFDQVVFVNNWLLSTNLYPKISAKQIQATIPFLASQFPDRPIIFRSVDAVGNPALYKTLLAAGCQMVFSRQVYYQNAQDPALWRRKHIKVDKKLLNRSDYRLATPLTPIDAPRIAGLYRQLYIEKYSSFNPQFTSIFFETAIKNQLFTFKAFQKSGDIDAVMGYYECNGIMTQPVFGYDTTLPQKLGLYRLLSLQKLLEARRHGFLVNASAGVGQFKRYRGGQPALEFNAVYHRHLPPAQRRLWGVLKPLLDRVAIPLIQKYGF